MFLSNRLFLLIYLVMLQFIAPLVHAHAGQQSALFGLHVPGLEALSASHHNLAYVPDVCHVSSEGFIFGVHDGINAKRLKIDIDNQPNLFIPPLPAVIKTVKSAVDYRFIAPSHHFVSHFLAFPLSPRAPPIG